MKSHFLKISGAKDLKEFYKMYPTEEAFMDAFPEYANGGSVDRFTELDDRTAAYYYINNIPLPNTKTSKKGKKKNITVTEEMIPTVPSTIPVPPVSFTPQPAPLPKNLKKKNISFEEQRDAKGNLIAYSPVFNNYTQSETRRAGKSLPDNINGVPVQFSPSTYGELWSGYLPGTQSDQWSFDNGGQPMNSNQIPYLNWNTMDQWQMPQQTTPPQDPRMKEYLMRRKVAGTLGAIGNGIQNTVDAFDTITQFATGIQNRKNQDKALEQQGLSDNQFYTGQGSDRGDYFNGMYKPNQMGNYSYSGMYNGVYYPTAALGIEVPVLPNTDGLVNTPGPGMIVSVPEKSSGNINNIKEFIKQRESSGNYGALPRKKDGKLASSAVGAYQFLWNQHKDWISRVTGVGSKEQFRTNPQAQDAAFDYWDKTVLTPAAKKIKSMFPNVSTNDAKAKIHFAGVQGAMDYYTRGIETTDAFGTKTSTYEVGGEYTLSEKEIENILRNGGEVEYL